MKFKARICPVKKMIDGTVCRVLADRKWSHLYRGFGCIYAHKNENLQKTRVSATSCVFEYYISNIKNQKRKKLRENWKTLHNLVLLVGFLIFRVLVCQLVGQKNQKKVRVFSGCKIVTITGVFFARKMHSTSKFAMPVLSKCVIHAGFVKVAWTLRGMLF